MSQPSQQRGVGLVEVLVALLLLAVAVLGFSALNIVSIKATDNSVLIANSNTIMRGLSEDLRLNSDNILDYQKDIQSVLAKVSESKDYCKAVADYKVSTATKNCDSNSCTEAQLASYNSWRVMKQACDNGILLNMITCPDTSGKQLRQCIITSWNDTKPVLGSNLIGKSCADTLGIYHSGSDCLIMESY